jgi:uroporphyrin-III C-methyltransferase
MNRNGKVFLVGAGPGDVELLTLKAVRVLGAADVVLVDDLVNTDVLQYARAGARIIPVGKRGGCKSTPQAFIERLLVHEARAGNIVVRLKGGDPFLFGRGGEELAALAAAGINVEVVGGVSAGMAAAAALGIAITQRGVASGVAFITGHTQDGAAQRWDELVKARVTLVIYMGIANFARIANNLVAAGMAPCMPVAIMQDATLPSQRSWITCLRDAAALIALHGIGSPSIIVVGEVVAASAQLAHVSATPATVATAATAARAGFML